MAITQQGWRSGFGSSGFLTSLKITNTIYVAKNGNDSTGERNNLSKPFLTISGANGVAQTGDCVYVFSGTYTETSDTFLGGIYYNLEENVIVEHTGSTIVDDLSGAKNIYIFGNGTLRTVVSGGFLIYMTNPDSTIFLNCQQITARDGGIYLSNTSSFDIYSRNINTSGIGIQIIGNLDGIIEFQKLLVTGGSTGIISQMTVDLSLTKSVYIKGLKATFNPREEQGVGLSLENQAQTRLFININNIEQSNEGGTEMVFINDSGLIVFNEVFFRQKNGNSVFEIEESPNVLLQNCQGLVLGNYFMNLRSTEGENKPIVTFFNTTILSSDSLAVEFLISSSAQQGSLSFTNCILSGCQKSITFTNDDNILFIANTQLISFVQSISSTAPLTPIRVQGSVVANQSVSANITNIVSGTNVVVDSDVGQNFTIYNY